jgi:formylglycine-generating enzyme required for sulfatase activity
VGEGGARSAPSEADSVWGGAPATCELTVAQGCLYNGNAEPHPVGTHPLGVSDYGFHDRSGNVHEWCSDWSVSYNDNPPIYFDPVGPPTGTYKARRSSSFEHDFTTHERIAPFRMYSPPDLVLHDVGIRCARRGY